MSLYNLKTLILKMKCERLLLNNNRWQSSIAPYVSRVQTSSYQFKILNTMNYSLLF